MKYGMLTVVDTDAGWKYFPNSKRQRLWKFRCDCGKVKTILPGNVRAGKTVSCGCYKAKHGFCAREKRSPEYDCWRGMNRRCSNPNDPSFACYGGRSIKICKRWKGKDGFVNFLKDLGQRPSKKHSVERINNDGNYEPSNCRWATAKEQSRNRRAPSTAKLNVEKVVEIIRRVLGGEKQRDLAKEFGVLPNTINRAVLGKCWRHCLSP